MSRTRILFKFAESISHKKMIPEEIGKEKHDIWKKGALSYSFKYLFHLMTLSHYNPTLEGLAIEDTGPVTVFGRDCFDQCFRLLG